MAERIGKYMSGSEIRSAFLRFFEERGHTVLPSSSTVPHGDPTLLFTNAGMVQFKDVFLGNEKRSYTRAVTSQKCVRAGGKHNDLDNVGFTARHLTFFEMLGNFSFGDYFKEEAITFAWDFLTGVLLLPKDRLWVTVYKDDDEAVELWQRIANVPASRIVRLGEEDNFWAMGDTGPCGPDSEVIVDRGEEHACGPDCGLGKCDCDRWLEVWNLVFMQYMRDESGSLSPLPRPSIDTGMGLERISSVLQGADTNYETDLFTPIIAKLEEMTGRKSGEDAPVFPFRVVADHIRSCVFLAADGVHPSNEGRGYVMRRILRRAVRFGQELGMRRPFLADLVPVVAGVMREAYPELEGKADFIQKLLTKDEERFLTTLQEGQKRARALIASAKESGLHALPGKDAFLLYDTFGFPIDLTKDMAREEGLVVDEKSFEEAMTEQRERSRGARQSLRDDVMGIQALLSEVSPTGFVGYDQDSCDAQVLGLVKEGSRATEMETGEEAFLVLDRTPCYAAGGGQESDRGALLSRQGRRLATILDVARTPSGVYLHKVKAEMPGVMVGQEVVCSVDVERRRGLERHHTATHLIHKALRTVVGDHAQQAGSLVQEDRLRFDFNHFAPLSKEELRRVEDMVNDAVLQDLPVSWRQESLEEAREEGAIALFGEKYGEEVRVVEIPGLSRELCGGTHVRRTGQVGQVQLVSESAIAAGVRRLEAVAGKAALRRLRQLASTLGDLASCLGTGVDEVREKVASLVETVSDYAREIQKVRTGTIEEISRAILKGAEKAAAQAGNLGVIVSRQDNMDVGQLRSLGDRLKEGGAQVAILGSVKDGRAVMIVMATPEAVKRGADAVKIVRKGAQAMGGSGGGKPEMAQSGGKSPEALDKALSEARNEAQRLLGIAQ
ncbi:MAG: alanine--tRNA ligase [Bacillota bacterium]|jgi:alanyl-tRNA synthetase